jgi:hypothetical protein
MTQSSKCSYPYIPSLQISYLSEKSALRLYHTLTWASTLSVPLLLCILVFEKEFNWVTVLAICFTEALLGARVFYIVTKFTHYSEPYWITIPITNYLQNSNTYNHLTRNQWEQSKEHVAAAEKRGELNVIVLAQTIARLDTKAAQYIILGHLGIAF